MFDDWERSIHDLELLKYRSNFCYLPKNSSENLKMDVVASFIKDFARYSSVDYVRKKFVKENELEESSNPYAKLLDDIKETIWKSATDIKKRRKKIILNKETEITLGLTASFMRLDNSFESSLFLISNQFYFESMSINRMIFEQLNYCFKLSQLSPKEFKSLSTNQIENILNSTNITKLKEYYKTTELGKLYSILSTVAHIGIKGAGEFISYDNKIDEHVVTMKSIVQSIRSAIYLLYITDLHGLIFEFCFHNKSNIDLVFNENKNGKLKPNPKRVTIIRYSEIIKRFEKLLQEVDVPIKYCPEYETGFNSKDIPF